MAELKLCHSADDKLKNVNTEIIQVRLLLTAEFIRIVMSGPSYDDTS